MARYSMAHLDEIEEIDDGRTPFRPVRLHFGITTFGAITTTARAAGDRIINEHEESEPGSSEELYVVISGHARFELDGESRDAPAGTLVHVPPGIKRTAFAEEAGTTVLAVGAGPSGAPYQSTGWEVWAPLFRLFESGDYAEGADRAVALLAQGPPSGANYYNTACFESLAGRTDAALEHLRRALELSPHLTDMARADDDFAPLHEHAAYAEIVGS